jgi:hypothetical protein
MCEKCAEIEKTIAWYRKIQRSINDQKTIDGAEKLIAELEVKKLALHPERKLVNHCPIIQDPLIVLPLSSCGLLAWPASSRTSCARGRPS